MGDIAKGCGLLLVALAALVLMPIYQGFILSIVWVWFMVPFGLPAIGIAWAIGLTIVVRLITHTNRAEPEEEKSKKTARLVGAMLAPLCALGVAYIAHLYM